MSGSRSRNQAAMQRMGLPADFKLFSAFPFAGLNQSASRIGMEDSEFYWLENYLRIDNGQLRTLGDAGSAFYTAPAGKTIVSFFWYAIGPNVYVAVFFSDGTANQVPFTGGQAFATPISDAAGTFYQSGGPLPACSQSGSQYLLIANNNTDNDYWIWDGAILYGAGGIAPFTADELTSGGSGYTSPPTVTVYGGSGGGAVLVPVIAEGSVVRLTVVNTGADYSPGDIAQVAFSGGGSDTTPILVAQLTATSVASVTLLAGGYNYAPGTYALGVLAGDGGGSGLTGTYTVVTPGPVSYISITSFGSGYATAPSIFFPSGGGTGASAVALLQPQGVAAVLIGVGGTNLFAAPTLTLVGGGGSGATATCTISGGTINSVTVTDAGSGYTTAPAVEVESGLNNAASAILTMQPFGVSGESIETYQGRVWLPFPNRPNTQWNGGVFFVSAPGSLTDFATSDGGLIFTNTDRFLRQQYTFMRQTSNFLYAVGDSSVSVISNPQSIANVTSGTVSTTISYQNTDPQTGAPWRDSAQDFGTTILFANPFGVWAVYGGAVRKVSKKVDNLFNNAVFPPAGGLTPSSAVANIYSQKVYLILMTITDPFTFKPRNVMLGHKNENEWIVVSQTPKLVYLGTKTVNSDLEAWGTDGTALYPLLAQPSGNLAKIISTKAWGGQDSVFIKTSHSLYLHAEDLSTNQGGLTFTGTVDGIGLAVPVVNSVTQMILSCPSISQPIANPLTFMAPKGLGAMFACGIGAGVPQVPAIGLGLTLATSSPDLSLRNVQLGYIELSAVA